MLLLSIIIVSTFERKTEQDRCLYLKRTYAKKHYTALSIHVSRALVASVIVRYALQSAGLASEKLFRLCSTSASGYLQDSFPAPCSAKSSNSNTASEKHTPP